MCAINQEPDSTKLAMEIMMREGVIPNIQITYSHQSR
jgi:hypothetical protein